jgi:transglutaminase-like putative cysteine protease
MAPHPSWVTPVADAPLANARPEGAGDYDYLLVDQQVRLSAVTAQYSRFVERMVNQASVDRAAQVSLEIDPGHDKLLVHDVRVFRDGRTIDKLVDARRSLLNRESNLDDGLIDGRVTLHLLLQDVRVGDVLDYSYTIERTDPFGERGYNNWFMTRWATPVRHFRLRVQHQSAQPLQIHDHSKLPAPAVSRRGDWTETTWEATDLPALPNEESRPAWHLFYPRIELSEFADWQAVRAWALPMYELKPAKDAALKALIAEFQAEPDEAKRLLRALRFVQDDIRYTGIEIGAGAYRPTQPREVLARRFGDCKDKVLLFVTIMRAVGVEAYPALVSTRLGHGVAGRAPGPGAFDHVIAKVNWKNRDYWLDATASGQGGRLDTTVQADFGLALVLDSSRDGLAKMPAREARQPLNHVIETFDFREGTRKVATLDVITEYRDEEADAMRVRMRTKTATDLGKDYFEYYRKSYAGIQRVSQLVLSDDRDENLVTTKEWYRIDAPFEKNSEGEWKFHLEAHMVSERTGVPAQTDRTTPLARRFPMHVRHEIVAHLPGGWDIDPAELRIVDPAFDYLSTTTFNDGRLSLDYRLRSTRDHVPVDGLGKFLVNLDKAHDDAYFTFTEGEVAPSVAAAAARKGPSIAMIVTLALGLGAGLLAALALTRLRRQLPDATPGAPQGLGGWLVLPVIGVTLGPLVMAHTLWIFFRDIGSAAKFAVVAPAVQWMLLIHVLLLGAGLVIALLTVLVMFRRMRTFPFAFITLQAVGLTSLAIAIVTLRMIGGEEIAAAHETNMLIFHTCIAAAWTGYMLRSERVRATFVRPWGEPHPDRAPPAATSLLASEERL